MRMDKRKKQQAGFTLVELIVVVAILGFLLSIAIPRYLTARTTAAQAATKANLHQLSSSMELYMTENPSETSYPADADTASTWLKTYIPKAPVPPGGGYYQYAPLDGNDSDTNPGDSYAIWDPKAYGGKYFAAGPGGAIGEGDSPQAAIQSATGIDPGEDPTGGNLNW